MNDNTSLGAEVGYQFYSIKKSDTTFLTPRGFKVNLEYRYYITKLYASDVSRSLGRVYIGLQPFFRQNQYNESLSYRANTDSIMWNDDDFGVKNTTYGLNCLIGYQKSISNKMVIDLHAGLGILHRNIKNNNLQYDKDIGDILAGTGFMRFVETLNLTQSSGIGVSVLLGIRIGYKL